ncbi:MAG: hypothetical protein ACJ8R9_04010 [Steroidobacteraceae bacterium]
MLNCAVLWVCIGLFFARVVGQIEVLLAAPSWLPAMQAWYSGLLPYPLLLPIQIALLMVMCVLAIGAAPRMRGAAARPAAILRTLALVYVAVMVVRLIVIVHRYAGDFYLHGAIPVAFHWVLALFILVWTRLTYGRSPRAEDHQHGWSQVPSPCVR